MRFVSPIRGALALLCTLVLASCGDSKPPAPPPGTDAAKGGTGAAISPPAGPRLAYAADVPVPPLPEMKETLAQGLVLTLEENGPADARTDRRSVRTPMLYVPAGTAPSVFLRPGPFKATFEGLLSVGLRDDYTFSADGRGTLVFEINGEKVLEASGDDFSTAVGKSVQLKKGANKFVARYQSPKDGDAVLRLHWAGSDFPREPLDHRVIKHNLAENSLREAHRVREGRELLAELRCVKCHAVETRPEADLAKGEGMPELGLDAPSLAEAGGRLNVNWMAHWIADPRSLRPDASMPKLLRGPEAAKDAADMAGYLATLGKRPDPPPSPPTEKEIADGGSVLWTLGCIGCHTLPDREEPAAGRVPLRYVRAKWKAQALREFLLKPDAHYAWIRMPDFKLSQDEANKLATFIEHQKVETKKPWPIAAISAAPDVERGKKLVQTSGCLNCHSIAAVAAPALPSPAAPAGGARGPALKDIAGKNWAKGCLGAPSDEAARGKAPDFGLSAEQRGALLAFAATAYGRESLAREALPEFAERQVRQLRCVACHKRDDREDVWSSVEEEVAAYKVEETPVKKPDDPNAAPDDEAKKEDAKLVDQTRPQLTWTGEKLKPEWMSAFLSGQVSYKPRTWMHARMPAFKMRASLLAQGLSMEHGCPPASPPTLEEKPDAEQAAIGIKLVARQNFACTACHAVGETRAVAVFEAPGINFAHVKERLLKNYFHRWLGDPLRVQEGSKMPQFVKAGGRTMVTDILDGDAAKQIEAMWHYMQGGEKMVAPEP